MLNYWVENFSSHKNFINRNIFLNAHMNFLHLIMIYIKCHSKSLINGFIRAITLFLSIFLSTFVKRFVLLWWCDKKYWMNAAGVLLGNNLCKINFSISLHVIHAFLFPSNIQCVILNKWCSKDLFYWVDPGDYFLKIVKKIYTYFLYLQLIDFKTMQYG